MRFYEMYFVRNDEIKMLNQSISMAQCKKDVTPVLTHWSYVFLAPTHRYFDYELIKRFCNGSPGTPVSGGVWRQATIEVLWREMYDRDDRKVSPEF